MANFGPFSGNYKIIFELRQAKMFVLNYFFQQKLVDNASQK